jgi:hypothetical protein
MRQAAGISLFSDRRTHDACTLEHTGASAKLPAQATDALAEPLGRDWRLGSRRKSRRGLRSPVEALRSVEENAQVLRGLSTHR